MTVGERLGVFGDLRGSAMAIAPQVRNPQRHNESASRIDQDLFDENENNNLSLLEENARLRRLVVSLSGIILKSVAEQS
jgi:hypothetical protein